MLVAALLLLAAGCGGDLQGEEIGCDWFSASSNCWKASLQAAAPCLPPAAETGELTSDGTLCRYESGVSIAFRRPVDLANLDNQMWDFELKRDGQLCLGFSEIDENRRALVTSLGVYREEVRNLGLQLTCPDGGQYKVVNVTYLLSCQDFQKHLPGISIAWNEDEVLFSFTGTGAEHLRIFTCRLGG